MLEMQNLNVEPLV